MPTILKTRGYRVVIYPADHRPAHVHVIGAGLEVVFDLNCPDGPLEVRNVAGKVSDERIMRIARLIGSEIAALCAAWRQHHGRY